jgi:predicted component of type VI protein secretion system
MAFQLVVIGGGRTPTTAPLKIGATGVTTVGRQEGCQFRIVSSQVSRKHCELFEKKGFLLVKDLGSSNGTLVNGKKVGEQQVLSPGDELRIGPVSFRVEKSDAAAAKADAAAEAVETEAVNVGADDVFDIEIEDAAPTTMMPSQPKTGTPLPSAPAKAAPKPPVPPVPTEIGEDAALDFLMNIDLDDEDKA